MSNEVMHDVVVVGGGTAGITVAARLKRAGIKDVAIIEPSENHYYQPLWTLVGGGQSKAADSVRPQAGLIPKGQTWIKDSASAVDPDSNTLTLASGKTVKYKWLVMAAGIQLNWSKVTGLPEALGKNNISSNYRFDLTDYTWKAIQDTKSGAAVFSMPAGPIKCAGAPQKITYLAADYWQKQGTLKDIEVHMVLPTPGMFGVPEFAATLTEVVKRYGIKVHFESEVTSVDPNTNEITIRHNPSGDTQVVKATMAHITPPQSAPDWIASSAIADPNNAFGYVEVDKHTLQHSRYSNIFGLGDCTTTPNSKTGAAVRKQAPVLVANLVAARDSKPAKKSYNGYASCPLITGVNKCVMAEFDYDLKRTPTFPILDMTKERYDMYQVKKHGLPLMYWNFMLKGRA